MGSGRQRNVENWRDIAWVSAGNIFSIGIKSDGTAVSVGHSAWSLQGDWSNLVEVKSEGFNGVGLKSNGDVIITINGFGNGNVYNWHDIISVSTGRFFTAGLKKDHTVVMCGQLRAKFDYEKWSDIVAIACGSEHLVGLKSDGTVVATGENVHGECNVNNWRLFNDIDTLQKEKDSIRQSEINRLETMKANILNQLPSITGVFADSKKKKLENELAHIEKEINELG